MYKNKNPLENLAENFKDLGIFAEVVNNGLELVVKEDGKPLAFIDLEGRASYTSSAIHRDDIVINRIKHCFMRFKEGRHDKDWHSNHNGMSEMGVFY